MEIKGKVVIVTGGAQGLGKTYCEALAREGAKVVAVDVAGEVEQGYGSVFGVRADITNEDDLSRMVAKTVNKFGAIDALVNNAAIYAGLEAKHFTEIDQDEWDRVMRVNIKGAWLCTKAVVPEMRKQKKGKVINISSGTVFGATPGLLHYITSKAAIIGMTRGMARELGDDNICVNCVAPGMTWNEASRGMFSEERALRSAQRRCLKRLEQPDDLAGAVKFLVSDESDFITGQTILVDGGTCFI
jgi:3-oxoacyl-[acyl-carrier protein] reductase